MIFIFHISFFIHIYNIRKPRKLNHEIIISKFNKENKLAFTDTDAQYYITCWFVTHKHIQTMYKTVPKIFKYMKSAIIARTVNFFIYLLNRYLK